MSNEFWQTIGDFVAAEMRGAEQERERIIKLLELLWQKTQGTDLPAVAVLPQAFALIKDESKMITSELLPDGTIYIEEVKGEQND